MESEEKKFVRLVIDLIGVVIGFILIYGFGYYENWFLMFCSAVIVFIIMMNVLTEAGEIIWD